ncbi:hypothetical protein [Streptomyces sp. NBC_01803]|nr:hypothetical protein [Streptomyces sp. NBC_01803]WSA43015.1 hypothetical protein OIE51_01685 [Streptomyces sp. NBC_01803]
MLDPAGYLDPHSASRAFPEEVRLPAATAALAGAMILISTMLWLTAD